MLLQDFATSSLRGEVAMENEEEAEMEDLEEYKIDQRKEWEKRCVDVLCGALSSPSSASSTTATILICSSIEMALPLHSLASMPTQMEISLIQ